MPRIARVVAAKRNRLIRPLGSQPATGRPLGTNDFIERLEKQLKRLFKLMTKGRLKKKIDK